ncbi:MAG: HupE/UreJ family protein [Gemmatimonadota bacterium]|nr:HupE/UreJ family protein [Gemmatimonadota bacterium]
MRRTSAIVVALVLLLPSWPEAHEIPADVTVQAFVAPEGNTLRLLIRVPLFSMREFDFPVVDPGYLQISEADDLIRVAAQQWIGDYVRLYEGSQLLPAIELVVARISPPSDGSFSSYETALANVRAPPLRDGVELPPAQALLDVLFEVPIASDQSDFSIDAQVAHLGIRTVTVLRFRAAGKPERAYQYSGSPGIVRLDPRWFQAAFRFIVLGFDHILDGLDHLLFLFCLVVPFRNFWALVPIVTSFTVAHSITLIAASLGLAPNALWFPPLIETLIALSIVFMAFENILGAKLQRRWLIAFAFGLIHGFGFSFALSESLQFAGAHLITSLFSFNVGVELGQLFVLAITVPALHLLFKKVIPELGGTIVLSAILAHTGWHWMTERGGQLLRYDFRVPPLDAAFFAAFLRWLMLLLIVCGAAWLLRLTFDWLESRKADAA